VIDPLTFEEPAGTDADPVPTSAASGGASPAGGASLADPARRRTLGRLAGMLFIGSGVVTLATVAVPAQGMSRIGVLVDAAVAISLGVIAWFLPWERWPSWSLFAVPPIAFALIALGNVYGGENTWEFGLFFVVAFVWIGVALPPLSAVWFSPLAAIAYAWPILFLPADQDQGLLTTAIVIPVCVLVGEVLARVIERLWHTQVSEREYAAAYVMERAAVRNLRALEQRLRDAESRYRTLVEQIPAVTYIDAMDAASTTLYISPQVEQLLGYAPYEWQSDAGLWERLLHPEDRERVLAEHLRSNGSTQPYADEYRLLARNGRVVWIRDEASIVHDDEGNARFWQGVMLDVTDRKRAQEQVAFLAYHDKLTGLPNLAMFEEHLGVALARAERQNMGVAVLYVDFDKFKLVNDTLGHGAGDQLLRDMVDRLQEATRATDLVARLGGDEFLILLADLEGPPPAGHGLVLAELVASRIHDSLQRPFQLGDTEFYISASIGISVYPLDARDAHSLVMHADQAMYRSKKTGAGGYVVFARDMASGGGALNLATQLRKAVAEKQWALHYQPIVDLVRGHIVGVEALLRWIHPDKGTVEPAMFVPLLEELGLIGVVSDWVLEELGRQCRSWREQDLELNVAFNLSPRGLWHPDLGTKLLDLTRSNGNDAGGITIEITESALEADPERAQVILRGLHEQGLAIALDDFGTGYSSLSRLRSLPIEILKIDRSFIHDVEFDRGARSVVRALIQLAHSLGMVPLAEGVETQGQLEYLAERGCTLGQGFYFSRPLPADQITIDLLERTKRSAKAQH
jgi:diguanylate cyclase (GGDEF)-like protein/PAS domain S-box-containing protein